MLRDGLGQRCWPGPSVCFALVALRKDGRLCPVHIRPLQSIPTHIKLALLIGVALLATAATYLLAPAIPQWPEYHDFADRASWLAIPNSPNVLSNALFVIAGLWGIVAAQRLERAEGTRAYRAIYRVVFLCVLLTGCGSAYYHWAPDTATLVWDRLPMGLGFMALFASVIAEMIDHRWAVRMLPVLLLLGLGSVMYWAWTETQGAGDLRSYGLVQFLPILLTLLIIGLFRAPPRYLRHLMALIAFYAIGKVLEYSDAMVFQWTGERIGGHSLKHLVAAGGLFFIVNWVWRSSSRGKIE